MDHAPLAVRAEPVQDAKAIVQDKTVRDKEVPKVEDHGQAAGGAKVPDRAGDRDEGALPVRSARRRCLCRRLM